MPKSQWPRWSQEPLLRFLLLGLLILGADRVLGGARAAPEGTRIVVAAAQQSAVRAAFRAEQGREPSEAELQARLAPWIDEQVLYREALARGLDRGDSIVRRQLVQKMRFVLEGGVDAPEPTEADLRDWHARNAARYAAPATVSFEHVFLSRGRHGARLAQAAAAVQAQLARAPGDFVGLGDPFPATQIVTGVDASRLRREFGPDFAAAVESLPPGQWSGPVASAFGLHLVRVTGREALRPLAYEEVASRVRTDYQVEQHEALRRAALERLRARYRVELEPQA